MEINFLLNIISGIFLAILVFLVLRVFVLWYWKIDKIERLLKDIEWNTRRSVDGSSEKDTVTKEVAEE